MGTVKVYFQGEYPSDHWALQPYMLDGDPKMVALTYYKGKEYAVYLNPTDKRGYRGIVRFINNQDMKSTINRDYTLKEKIGLALTVRLVSTVYEKINLISQTISAGNNSHSFNPETGITYLGKAEEPSILHEHILGRGDPEGTYIDDVKLDGPAPGLNFDLMGKTPHEPGNGGKVKWKEGEMEKVATRLKFEIQQMKPEFLKMGLVVMTSL